MKRVAIIDNSVLIYSLKLNKVDLHRQLRNVFANIFIPEEVRNEFIQNSVAPFYNKRKKFIDDLKINSGFFRLCTTYDKLIREMVSSIEGIDNGEAEAIAQLRKRNIYFFLTDDRKCIDVIENDFSDITILDTISLIAVLDVYELISNYNECIIELHQELNFSSEDLRKSYLRAAKFVGKSIDKKILSKKTSLSKILRNKNIIN